MLFFIEAGTDYKFAFSCRVMIFTTRKTVPSSTAPFSGFPPPYSPLIIDATGDCLFLTGTNYFDSEFSIK